MPEVVVGIATYKRPHMLRKALASIAGLKPGPQLAVVVADNSADGEGLAVVGAMHAEGYSHPLTGITVSERGIPHARNALVAAAVSAGARWIAFMDDDQVAHPGWLNELLAAAGKANADVVGSAVKNDFDGPVSPRIRGAALLRSDDQLDGIVPIVLGTGGVLISLDRLQQLGDRPFNGAFALSGGSDSELFHRLRKNGTRFARAIRSVVYETYPSSRLTLRWLLQRSLRTGAADMKIALSLEEKTATLLREGLKIGGVFFLAPIHLFLAIGRPARQIDVLCRIARACGKVMTIAGGGHDEYRITHGR